MPQENLQRVQAAFDAYFQGDQHAMLELVRWEQRFRVESSDESREVEGFQEARELAHELADV